MAVQNSPRMRQQGNGDGKITYLPDVHRLLPQSSDAEQGVLGSFLLSPLTVGEVCTERNVTPEHFHIPGHQIIYREILELWNKRVPIDVITLTQVLRDKGLLDSVGGAALVTDLFTFLPTAANIRYYIDILFEKSVLRNIIEVSTEYGGRAYEDQRDVPTLLDEFEQKVLAIHPVSGGEITYDNGAAVMNVIERLEWMIEHPGEISGLPTGFADLDVKTNGLQPDQMCVLAARPSMGKTALATNIAEHCAMYLKQPAAIFSLEMSKTQLMQRIICSRARVNLERMIAGDLHGNDLARITEQASKVRMAPLYIIDDSDRSVETLKARARRIKREKDVQLIVVDYLQLLNSRAHRTRDNQRNQELSFVSMELKALAKELHIPVIVIAALNRDPEKRSDGRPRQGDLRECGQIEYDADVIFLLNRPEVYADTTEQADELAGEAVLDVAKNKQGSTGDVRLTFLREFTRFQDRARNID